MAPNPVQRRATMCAMEYAEIRASDDLLDPCAHEGGTFRDPSKLDRDARFAHHLATTREGLLSRPFESTLEKVRLQRANEHAIDVLVKIAVVVLVATVVAVILNIVFG